MKDSLMLQKRMVVIRISMFLLWVLRKKHTDATTQPNIVIILVDDVGFGDVASNWNPTGRRTDTPFLDYMAENGIRFTDLHSGASTCAPSRAALMTGRHGKRTGFFQTVNPSSVAGLPVNETTFAETFKDAGYSTAMIGKWHLGLAYDYHPNSRGFDLYYGIPYSNGQGCTLSQGYSNEPPDVCPDDWPDNHDQNDVQCFLCQSDSTSYPAVPLFYNRQVIEQPVNQTTLSQRYSEVAAKFIREKNTSTPFLLYVALAQMHVPLFHMPEFDNTSQSGTAYGDTLLEMDNTFKTIVDAVKESNQERNTLIWITSDNGPDSSKCQFGGDPGPFFGIWQKTKGGGGSACKYTVWECGHRVPSIAYWPGTIPGGQVSDVTVSIMDIYPTIAALANVSMPGNRVYDGIDISNLLLGKPYLHAKRILFHPRGGRYTNETGSIDGVRVGDYKAVFYSGGNPDCEGNTGIFQRHDPPLIFNVKEDLMESRPLDTNTYLYRSVLTEVYVALDNFEQSVKMDNTTTVDYDKKNPCIRPCCNPLNVNCRCD